MPTFQHNNANLHYQEMGSGEPIIALHGLSQHSAYWLKTGVGEALSQYYRIIALDYRGHGLTKVEGDIGYDMETCLDDLQAFVNHLGLQQFHLMGHSTGGMIASRYAMEHAVDANDPEKNRLLSLILCNTSPSTQFSNLDEDANKAAINALASSFENFTWEQMLEGLKNIQSGPLFAGMVKSENKDTLFKKALEIMKEGNGKSIGAFVRSFYKDNNPREAELAKIICPTLVITAELDHIFCKTSQFFTKNIPNHHHEHHPTAGHMTNVECPDWMSEKILGFLQSLS